MEAAEATDFDILVNAYLKDMTRCTSKQSSVNMAYTAMNAAIVALPFACNMLGIPLFILVVGVNALVSYYLSNMVVKMAEDHSLCTLEDLGNQAFGRSGFIVMCLAQMGFSIMLIVGALIIWGDTVPAVVESAFNIDISDVFLGIDSNDDGESGHDSSGSYWHRHLCLDCIPITVLGAMVILPLCFQRTMASLAWCSHFSVLTMVCGMLAIMVAISMEFRQFDHGKVKESMLPKAWWWAGLIAVNFCFFPTNQRVFYVYNSLARRSPERWAKVTKRSINTLSLLFIFLGIMGSCVHENSDLINFFHDLPPHGNEASNTFFDIVRCLVCTSLLLTIPVHSLVAMTCGRRLLKRLGGNREEAANDITFTGRLTIAAEGNDTSVNLSLGDDMSRTWFSAGAADENMWCCNDTCRWMGENCCNCYDWFEDSSDTESVGEADGDGGVPPPDMFIESSGSNERIVADAMVYTLMDDVEEARDVAARTGGRSNSGSMHDRGGPDDEGGGAQRVAEADCADTALETDAMMERASSLSSGKQPTVSTLDSSLTMFIFNCRRQDWRQVSLGVFIWTLSLLIAVLIRTLALPLLIVSTVVLTGASLVLPSMIYFRLGVPEDYQAIPILSCFDYSGVLPNRLFMMLTQVLGLFVVIGCCLVSTLVICGYY
jgi:hypothetical protein